MHNMSYSGGNRRTRGDSKTYYIWISDGNDAGTLWQLAELISPESILITRYDGDTPGMLKQAFMLDIKEITYHMVHLLLAVPPPLNNRVKVVSNDKWMQEGVDIVVGTLVQIFKYPGLEEGASGTVQFKGRLPGSNGISFGVELHRQYHGKGSTNGEYRRKKLFTCDEDCGIFVSIFRIRIYSAGSIKEKVRSQPEGDSGILSSSMKENSATNELASVPPDDFALKLKERVVWMSDFGPEFGTVRWVGILPYSVENNIVVGVEFDNEVGSGTGKFKGHQLFRTKRNHASLIPILGLLKASTYMSMMSISDPNPDSIEYGDITVQGNTIEKYSVNSDKDINNEEFQTCNFRSKEEWVDNLTSDVKEKLSMKYKARGGAATDVSDNDESEQRFKYIEHTSESKKLGTYEEHSQTAKLDNPSYLTMDGREENQSDLKVESRVSVSLGHAKQYGVIKWIGTFPTSKTPDRVIAGLQMETRDEKCYTNGVFLGEKVFECPPNRAFFLPLNKCEADLRM